jgi:hypothetical protein
MSDSRIFVFAQGKRKHRLMERLDRLPAVYLQEVLSLEEALVHAQAGKPAEAGLYPPGRDTQKSLPGG